MTEPLNEKKENVGLSDSNAGLGLPKFCTVLDMNWSGEVMHGELKNSDAYGDYYMMEDGDCYQHETLSKHYGAVFSDDDTRVPNV